MAIVKEGIVSIRIEAQVSRDRAEVFRSAARTNRAAFLFTGLEGDRITNTSGEEMIVPDGDVVVKVFGNDRQQMRNFWETVGELSGRRNGTGSMQADLAN
jgi:hypothetical protein